MEYGENPEVLSVEHAFIHNVETLLEQVDISEYGEQASVYYPIKPGTELADLAIQATQGYPDAIQVRQVAYPMEYGVDKEYFVSFFERIGEASIRVSYDFVAGELQRSINFVGPNPNARGLAMHLGGKDTESRQKAADFIDKLMQDERDKEQAATSPQEDPDSFEAVNQILVLLASR